MKYQLPDKIRIIENKYILTIVIITVFSFFYIQWPVVFTTHDDMYYAMLVKQDIVSVGAVAQAINAGRFYFLYTMYLYAFPYIFNSVLAIKIISLLSIAFSICCLTYFLYKHINKTLSILAVVFFFAFAQLSNEHNVFTSYVFHHQVTIGLILLSLCHLLTFYKTGEKKYINYSFILYTICIFIYEGFLMYSLVLFATSCYGLFCIQGKKATFNNLMSAIINLKYHICSSIIFLICYTSWSVMHPANNYLGATFNFTNLKSTIKVIVTYAFGLFPGSVFFHNKSNIDLKTFTDSGTIIKSFLIAFVSITLVKKIKLTRSFREVWGILIILLLGTIVPCIPYGLTSVHVEWVNGGSYGYVPSFFSYFFLIAFISLIFSYFFSRLKYKSIVTILSFIAVFAGVYLTDCSNKYFAKYFLMEFNKNKAFDRVVSSKEFLDIPENSVVYIPDYLGLLASMNITEDYLKTYSSKKVTLVKNKTDLDFINPTFMIRYDNDSQCIYWGRIDMDFNTDQIIFYCKDELPKSIILGTEDIAILENDFGLQQMGTKVAAVPLIFSSDLKSVLRGKDIELDTVNIINDTVDMSTISTKYIGGFYEEEAWGCWSNGNGIIEIENKSDIELNINMELILTSASFGSYHMGIVLPDGTEIQKTIDNKGITIDSTIKLFPGKNLIQFESDAPAIQIVNDNRNLAFSISNVKMQILEIITE